MALMHGFCAPLSADPGQRIEFRISTTADSYTVTILRFRNHNSEEIDAEDIRAGLELDDEPILDSFVLPGKEQPPHTPDEACMDWDRAFMVDITDEWKSGLYAAKCVDEDDSVFYVVFIVNPNPTNRNSILVLANANTWNAYNDMGGYSRYEINPDGNPPDQAYRFSYLRPNPSLINPSIEDGDVSPFSPRAVGSNVTFQSRHLARGEAWFLNWLEDAGFSYDLTSDLDWHFGVADVEQYSVVVLHTHPEYWSVQMMENLRAYLDQGGNLLYLGGNGIYDVVEISDDGDFMTVFGNGIAMPQRAKLFRSIGLPESLILGVRYVEPNNVPSNAYTVRDAAHPFFDGVVLPDGSPIANGSLIGERGWNTNVGADDLASGAASGWEVDTVDSSNTPPGLKVLAENVNISVVDGVEAFGAHMIYFDHPGGGFVFSTGAIKFCGSVVIDVALQQLVSNALNAALA